MTTTADLDRRMAKLQERLAKKSGTPTATGDAEPTDQAPSAPTTTGNGHIHSDTHHVAAVPGGSTSRNGHPNADTHSSSAVPGPTPTSETGHPTDETHLPFAGLGATPPNGHTTNGIHQQIAVMGLAPLPSHVSGETHPLSAGQGPLLADPFLALAAEAVNELEDSREKVAAHLRELLDENIHNCPPNHPEVVAYQALLDSATKIEEQSVKNLERLMAAHPLGAWQKATIGIGAKQLGRLLGAIRDPYWNERDNRARGVNELWAYCGYDTDRETGQARRRKRGEKANWSGEAKMRAYLLAKQQVKTANSPYRSVYDQVREHYTDAVHSHPCIQCGQKGKPAPAGTPLKLGHQHGRGLRAVAKRILKDLWIESERLHREAECAAGA